MAKPQGDALDVHVQLAETCCAMGLWSCGITHFRAAASLQPTNALLHFNLGNAMLNQRENGTSESAVPHFERALSLDPSRDDFRSHLGVALVKSGQTEKARPLLKACLQNENPDLHIFVAFSIEELVPALTISHLERCVEIDGGRKMAAHAQRTSVYYRLGRLYRSSGQLDDERRLFERAIALGIWQHPMQHPGFLRPGLAAVPFPSPSDAGFGSSASASASSLPTS